MRDSMLIVLGVIGIIGVLAVYFVNGRSVLRSLGGVCAIAVACIFSYQLFLPLSQGVSVYRLQWPVMALSIAPILVFIVMHFMFSVIDNYRIKRQEALATGTLRVPAEAIPELPEERPAYRMATLSLLGKRSKRGSLEASLAGMTKEAIKAEKAREEQEARWAEEARKAEEARIAEEARKADEAQKAEEARIAEEAKKASILEKAAAAKAGKAYKIAEALLQEYINIAQDEKAELRAMEMLLECRAARKDIQGAKELAEKIIERADEAGKAKMLMVLKLLR